MHQAELAAMKADHAAALDTLRAQLAAELEVAHKDVDRLTAENERLSAQVDQLTAPSPRGRAKAT